MSEHNHSTNHHIPKLGTGTLPTEDPGVGLGHIVSFKTYTWVYFTLVMLTGITVWAAFQDFGIVNLELAMAIATCKAGIVTLIFMHLNYENKIIWGIVLYPLFILVLLIGGTVGDVAAKSKPHSKAAIMELERKAAASPALKTH